MLHNELLETWDERGLPLENFNVTLPAISEAVGFTGCEDLPNVAGSWDQKILHQPGDCSSQIDASCFEPFVFGFA